MNYSSPSPSCGWQCYMLESLALSHIASALSLEVPFKRFDHNCFPRGSSVTKPPNKAILEKGCGYIHRSGGSTGSGENVWKTYVSQTRYIWTKVVSSLLCVPSYCESCSTFQTTSVLYRCDLPPSLLGRSRSVISGIKPPILIWC